MRALLAAIGQMLSSLRTVYEWCAKTSRLVAREVITLGGLLGGGGSAPAPVVDRQPLLPLTDFRLPDVERWKKITRLAEAMDGPDVDAGYFLGISDPTVSWLSAMSTEMRGLVVSSSAIALEDHMKCRKSIRGLLAYDKESVQAWKDADGGGAGGRKPPLRSAAAGFGRITG